MGAAIGVCWAHAGHEVAFAYARDEHRLQRLAARSGRDATATSVAEAVAGAEVLLIAVPWSRVDDVLAQAGNLSGRLVLDCTLPMTPDDSGLAIGLTMSGGEVLQARTQARVVKAFNTVPAEFIASEARRHLREPASLLLAGDDPAGKAVAYSLVADAGFDPVDAGPLRVARYLEPLALLMGQLAYVQRPSPEVGYRLIETRSPR